MSVLTAGLQWQQRIWDFDSCGVHIASANIERTILRTADWRCLVLVSLIFVPNFLIFHNAVSYIIQTRAAASVLHANFENNLQSARYYCTGPYIIRIVCFLLKKRVISVNSPSHFVRSCATNRLSSIKRDELKWNSLLQHLRSGVNRKSLLHLVNNKEVLDTISHFRYCDHRYCCYLLINTASFPNEQILQPI